MDENATKALYIAVTIFIVMLTIGFVVAYFNTARKAGNLAILGSAVAENYEKLLNSDLDKTEMTGVEVINMLRKYGGKYLFCFANNVEIKEGTENIPFIYVMTDKKLMTPDRAKEQDNDIINNMYGYEDAIIYMDGNGNVPSKFLETINPNIVYNVSKIDRSKLTNAQIISEIFCGADIRFDISVKNSKDYAFISPETKVYASTETGTFDKYEDVKKTTFTPSLEYLEGSIIAEKVAVNLICRADVTFSVSTSGQAVKDKLVVETNLGNLEVYTLYLKPTDKYGEMNIVLNGLKEPRDVDLNNDGKKGAYLTDFTIKKITIGAEALRSRDGKYSTEISIDNLNKVFKKK